MMNFSQTKDTLLRQYEQLPSEDIINFFIFNSLKRYNNKYTELTERDRYEAWTFKLEKTKDEWKNFDKEYYEKYPRDSELQSLIAPSKINVIDHGIIISEKTAEILSDRYFQYKAERAQEAFISDILKFELKYIDSNYLETLVFFEQLINHKRSWGDNKKIEAKNLNWFRFNDISRNIQKNIKIFLEDKFNNLNEMSYHKNLNIGEIELFEGMTYLTYKNVLQFLEERKDFSSISYLYQRLNSQKLINSSNHMEFANWLKDSLLIDEFLYNQVIQNPGFKTLKNSSPVRIEPLFDGIF